MKGQLKYCPHCLGNDITSKQIPELGKYGTMQYYTIYKGFIAHEFLKNLCPNCKEPLTVMNLTVDEWIILNDISLDQNFIFAMDKLKQDDIIQFTTKMNEFNETHKQTQTRKSESQISKLNIPKCPVCSSTKIHKISGAKRWVGTGLFGISSSDMGKTMQCDNCGYKF